MAEETFDLADLGFDDVDLGYDPLADIDVDAEDEDASEGQLGPNTEARPVRRVVEDNRTVPQKIEDLFAHMAPRRRVLLGILRYLDSEEPRRADALSEKVDELQKHDFSVYSGYNFSVLLERAGAITKVMEDGSEWDDDFEQQPDIVEIDGVSFYKPTDGKQVFWTITPEGKDYLESDDPKGKLDNLLMKEPHYLPLFAKVLDRLVELGECTLQQVEDVVRPDPLANHPYRHSSYFLKGLEDCSMAYWGGSWQPNELTPYAVERVAQLLKEQEQEQAQAAEAAAQADQAKAGEAE